MTDRVTTTLPGALRYRRRRPDAVMSARRPLGPAQSAPTDRIGIGVIGLATRMGFAAIMQSLLKRPEAECVALCDVDADVLAKRTGEVDGDDGQGAGALRRLPPAAGEPRRGRGRSIGKRPDHWHCLQMVMACEAGKDVYDREVASPIRSRSAGSWMAAAERYGRVVQVLASGSDQRTRHWEDAIEFLRSGALGRIRERRGRGPT